MKYNIESTFNITYPQEERYFKLRDELTDFLLNLKNFQEKNINFAGKNLYISFSKILGGSEYFISLDGFSSSTTSLEELPLNIELDIILFSIYQLELKSSTIQYS